MMVMNDDDIRRLYFTSKGVKVLKNRLDNLCRISSNPNQKYPFSVVVLGGFPMLVVNSKFELDDRIKELSELLLCTIKEEEDLEVNEDDC